MPAALTHYLFALENLSCAEDGEAFLLGTQGPDPFFFYGMVPWRKKEAPKKIRDYGEWIHHHDFSPIYAEMARYAHSQSGEKKATLLSYLLGLWLHYCLDRACHPYVFYRSGFDEEGQLKGHYGYAHKVFEALLDATLASQHKLPSAKKAMDCAENKVRDISAMWEGGSPETLSASTFCDSWRDYRTVEGFLQSKTGWKRAFWKILGKENVLYAFSYPTSLEKKARLDVLNLGRAEWKNPVTGVPSNDSIPLLFAQAKELFLKGREALLRFGSEGEAEASLLALQSSLDHDGCLWGEKKKFKDEKSPF